MLTCFKLKNNITTQLLLKFCKSKFMQIN